MLDTLADWDRWLFLAVNQGLKDGFLDRAMPPVSDARWLIVPGVFALVWAVWKGTRRARWALVVLVVVFAAGDALSAHVLKPLFGRPRPYAVLTGIPVYKNGWTFSDRLEKEPTLSFPSNHAVNMAGAAVILSFFFRRGWILWIAAALAVCFSRVYLGLHWPADVAAGIFFGAGLAGLILAGLGRLSRAAPRYFSWFGPEEGRS